MKNIDEKIEDNEWQFLEFPIDKSPGYNAIESCRRIAALIAPYVKIRKNAIISTANKWEVNHGYYDSESPHSR